MSAVVLMSGDIAAEQKRDTIMKKIATKIKRILTGKQWSVFVGGGEVNDYLLTKDEARRLAAAYAANGYDDIAVCKY